MFDSPFTYCAKCGEMVLLDQTRRECAAEHRCGDVACPLAELFSGIDFQAAQPAKATARAKREKRK
jgi:hypothetical protein